jgi:hypothetical protein
MTSQITFSTSTVQDSITNSNATTILDSTQPLSFLEFIKNTNVDYTPDEYNNFYLFYLKEWTAIFNTKNVVNKLNYVDLYINFLKELIITYSTQQELKFISTLDFTDPVDLDIIIPIYVEKIRQIIVFYKERRDKSKYVVDRNKIKGTVFSIERAIFEKIYNYIVISDQQPQYTYSNLTVPDILKDMQISIEEFVDVYGNYFDIPSTNIDFNALTQLTVTTNDIFTSRY